MTEAAWNPISPELSASATIGFDLSWLPTHSRSAAAVLDMWHSLATHEQALWPVSRCWLRFLAAATTRQSLEAVDGGAQTPGIDEIVVGVTLEILDRRLELDEFIKHVAIIRTLVWYVHIFSVNLYSRQTSLQRRHARPSHPLHRLPMTRIGT